MNQSVILTASKLMFSDKAKTELSPNDYRTLTDFIGDKACISWASKARMIDVNDDRADKEYVKRVRESFCHMVNNLPIIDINCAKKNLYFIIDRRFIDDNGWFEMSPVIASNNSSYVRLDSSI